MAINDDISSAVLRDKRKEVAPLVQQALRFIAGEEPSAGIQS